MCTVVVCVKAVEKLSGTTDTAELPLGSEPTGNRGSVVQRGESFEQKVPLGRKAGLVSATGPRVTSGFPHTHNS